jgi:hypothetical protein
MPRYLQSLALGLAGFAGFALLAFWRADKPPAPQSPEIKDRVVISAPVLIGLFGGDRYLAANFETMRLAATGMESGRVDSSYLIRAQREVARLNPCHEDNYYLANGLLTWGGAVTEGNEILRAAMDCRFWDGMPGFFYAVNKSFFDRDIDEAERALRLSAARWPENEAALLKFAVMLRVKSIADEQMALNYLTQQRDSSANPKLRAMFDKRVLRLQQLIALRAAQRRYEKSHGPLTDLQQLVSAGVLPALPEDPLQLGYELRNGRIELKKLKISGMEEQP